MPDRFFIPSPILSIILITCWCCSNPSMTVLAMDEIKIEFRIEEEIPLQSQIGDVLSYLKATNEMVKFVLLESTHSRLFSFDKGILKTKQRIDRESICPSLAPDDMCIVNIKVIVPSGATTQHTIIDIRIIIDDINDHTPTFTPNVVELTIQENAAVGSKFAIPSAVDSDSGSNSIRIYELVNASRAPFSLVMDEHEYTDKTNYIRDNERFAIKSVSLKLEKRLDRERENFLELTLHAQDKGISPRTGTLYIKITVEDVNDNKPTFERSLYKLVLDEERSYNRPVLEVQATDNDEGVNGKVLYYITKQSQDDTFKINSETGELMLKNNLDFESRSFHTIEITARDNGAIQFTDTAIVQVTVNDLNDNPPKISLTSVDGNQTDRIIVSENLELPFTFAFISVTDFDEGLNGKCLCQLTNHTDKFHLKSLNGNIYSLETNAKLDREFISYYKVGITCWDQGSPSLNSTLQLHLDVSDQNDNAPNFIDQSFHVEVTENAEEDSIITKIFAIDSDVGKNAEVRYRIEDDDVSQMKYVLLDEESGFLRVGSREFDYEDRKHFRFKVVAFDLGSPSLTATAEIILDVIDSNDQAPIFNDDVLKFRIFENQTVGIFIASIETTDLDENRQFQNSKYHLSCCDDDDSYESSCYFEKSAAKNIAIYNDNILKEYFAPNTLLNLVMVNELTGELRSNAVFDRERDSAVHFCIVATNIAHPYFSSTVQVVIEIDDINDNPPNIVFPKPDYILEVSSWTEEGDVLLRIFAEDPDKNETNSLLSYYPNVELLDEVSDATISSVQNGNFYDGIGDIGSTKSQGLSVNDLFTVDRYTGDIRLIRFLRDTDCWNDTTFVFAFSVNDSGNPTYQTEGSFNIHIQADDDFKLRDFKRSTNFSKFVNSNKNLFVLLVLCSSTFLLIVILTVTICYTKWRMRKSGQTTSTVTKSGIPPAVYLVNVVEKDGFEKDSTIAKKKLENFEHSPYPVKRYNESNNQLSTFSVNSQNQYDYTNASHRPHCRHQLQNSPSSDSGRGQSETADVIMMMGEKALVSKTPLFQQTYEPRVSGFLENGIFNKRGYDFLEAHNIALNGKCVNGRGLDDETLTETFI